jgi:hypothetical protein
VTCTTLAGFFASPGSPAENEPRYIWLPWSTPALTVLEARKTAIAAAPAANIGFMGYSCCSSYFGAI